MISVMSGKGGVGKSTMAVFISHIIYKHFNKAKKILLLDIDLCGPSISTLLNNTNSITYENNSFKPIEHEKNFFFLSFGNILKESDAVIWRGPKKSAVLEKILTNLVSNYDYVIVDTPPGISEEHNNLLKYNPQIIAVTSSQNLALNDTQATLDYALENDLSVIGLIQNMTTIKCYECNNEFYPFGSEGGKLLAKEYNIELLAELNMDVNILNSVEDGTFYDKLIEFDGYNILKEVLNNKF
ncbi:NUBP2 [Hepatospora eriocheir]|uniref:NUBP2 n=1 Tax=Hepatospora eriocheir TaxID=1081669 RepID=A0A1X0QGS2_9MICR|nr:NUBP2 [Hepatospora eriocheir]